MYLQPIKHRVLIHRDDKAEKSNGTHGAPIVIPGTAKTPDENRSVECVKGTVIAVGEEVDLDWVAPADRVIYRWYTGDELKINGRRCVMIHSGEILAREKRDGE